MFLRNSRPNQLKEWFLRGSLLFFMFNHTNAYAHGCNVDLEYQVEERSDGGYELSVICVKRSSKLITSEGFFPKKTTRFKISLIGSGKDWDYRNQNGFFYSLDKILSRSKAWDLGYVWVDSQREYIYLNLYWVSSPDNLKPSVINDKYVILGKPR